MPLNLDQKKAIVAEVSDVAKDALSAVVSDYRGLTVAEITELRAKARENNVYLRVVPNNLARLAFTNTDFSCMNEALVGPLLYAFSKNEPGSAAKLIKEFVKEHEALEVKALAISGKLLAAKEIDKVAKLPTRDEAIATLMSVMKAPITKFVRTVNEPHAKFVRTVAAYRDQRQAA